jgi:hypothetical protein
MVIAVETDDLGQHMCIAGVGLRPEVRWRSR